MTFVIQSCYSHYDEDLKAWHRLSCFRLRDLNDLEPSEDLILDKHCQNLQESKYCTKAYTLTYTWGSRDRNSRILLKYIKLIPSKNTPCKQSATSYTSVNFSQKPQEYGKGGPVCLQEHYSFHIEFCCAESTLETKIYTLSHSTTR